jgi:3',5'-cyclic-AMP phosphodiesterase
VLIAQLTDTHVMLPGVTRFFMGDTMAHLERAVAAVNAHKPLPDAVVVTGDLADRGQPAEYARVRDALDTLRCPYFVVPGNHDRRSALREAFAGGGYLPMGDGPLNYAIDRFPVRIVALDTVDEGNSGAAVPPSTLAWLEATLTAAPAQPVLLCTHHPPFRTGMRYMDALGFAGLEELQALLARSPQVKLAISGHVHSAIVSTSGGVPARSGRSTAPQVVPELFERRLFWIRRERPTVTLHRFDERAQAFVTTELRPT